MKRNNEELIIEFHKKMSADFPDITIEQAKEICSGPWKFLKEEMEKGTTEEIRFKYFGTFQVYPGRAKNLLSKLKDRFRFNKINKDDYFRIKEMLEKFINNEEN